MWLICSECGATLPSSRARCPTCGRPPSAAEPPARRRTLWPLLVVLVLLGGATAGAIFLDPPFLENWAASAGLTFD
jgi:hypothetical protein